MSLLAVIATSTTLLIIGASGGESNTASDRQEIGKVFGKSIYRDQIRSGPGVRVDDELHRLFLTPIAKRYVRDHTNEVTPSEEEFALFVKAADLRQQLEAQQAREHHNGLMERVRSNPDLSRFGDQLEADFSREEDAQKSAVEDAESSAAERDVLRLLAANWKFQRHLYNQYGGGRLIWQQLGVEAYDATQSWLQAEERLLHFEIYDPDLRASFYKAWNSQAATALIDDPEEIAAYLESSKIIEFVENADLSK
jgi:hypothetical protein